MEFYTKMGNEKEKYYSFTKAKKNFYKTMPKNIRNYIYMLKGKATLEVEIFNNKVVNVDAVFFENDNIRKSANRLSEIEALIVLKDYYKDIIKHIECKNKKTDLCNIFLNDYEKHLRELFERG